MGSMGNPISSMGSNANTFGSVEEKLNKQNQKYYRSTETEKNLYHGTILAQNRHKDKVIYITYPLKFIFVDFKSLEMVRLEDYSLIRNMNVPDEIKGLIKRNVMEKSFNENIIRDDVKYQINNQSAAGINPNIFTMNSNNSFLNQPFSNGKRKLL